MKKILLVLMILCLAFKGFPQKGNFGMGIILGNPTAFSIKWWTGSRSAIDASLGYHYGNMNHLHLNTNLLLHIRTIEKEQETLKFYFGPGAGMGFISDLSITVRAPLGAAIYPNNIPLELFGELVPVVQLIGPGDNRFMMDGYIGARWYF